MSPDPVTVVVPTHPLVVESEPGDGPAEHRHDD
jgi:hypothetical protein